VRPQLTDAPAGSGRAGAGLSSCIGFGGPPAHIALLRRLCVDLPPAPPDLSTRVAALGLATVAIEDRDDVLDPAGHDGDVYGKVVDELWELCQALITRL